MDTSPDETNEIQNKPYVPMTFWESMEFNRMFVSPMLLLVAVILGGIAAGFGAWNSTVKIAMVMTPAMAVLAFTLSLLSMRIILGTFVFSLLMDALVMII
tara:strand:+ start:128 stop:427 length:300 start_codon:yes stop_codon:yes gene_type:complete